MTKGILALDAAADTMYEVIGHLRNEVIIHVVKNRYGPVGSYYSFRINEDGKPEVVLLEFISRDGVRYDVQP